VVYPAYGPCGYLTNDELTHIRAMYAGEATLVDRWIGFLLEKIDELGLLNDTTIIFTSDHGFYLGEHSFIGKSIIMGGYHGLAPLYEEVVHIPLLIRFADKLGLKRGFRIDTLVQTPDITATILELAYGKDVSGMDVQGRSLLPIVKGEETEVREIAVSTPSLVRGVRAGLRVTVTTDRWSLILAPEESKNVGEGEITFIVNGEPRVLKADPRQKANIISEEMDVAMDIYRRFIGFLSKLGATDEVVKPWLKCIGLKPL
ncbi:MAG: sulfatase-like hydrolase/transferase, partial [Candidatus Bathyarchaeota archaeon]|nr:sulfatase-like hydrolase/transferase [Candidatus Bathyarchaeota archaeon]